MNENSSAAQQYLDKCFEIFNRPTLSTDDINYFIKTEKQNKMHLDPAYADKYCELFTLIRNRIILPNAGKLELVPLFEEFLILLKASNISLSPHPQADQMVVSIIKSMEQNEYFWRFKLIQMALIIKTFNGADFRDEYIGRLFEIPSAACFRGMNEAQQQARIFRSIFSSCAEFMRCSVKNVFNESFLRKDLMTQKSAFMWILEVCWNIVFKESPEHMEIMPAWFKIFDDALDKADKELIFYMHMPLSHIYLNMCHTQEQFKVFNDKVEMPLAKYIQKNMRKWGFKPVKKKLPESGVRKIAFVYDRIVGNSPGKLLMSLLTYLKDEQNLKLFVYDMGYVEKAFSDQSMVQEIKNLGVTYVNNHDLIDEKNMGHHYSHFNKVVKLREQALKDDIDILVATGNRLPSGFLLATRIAPLQIFWDHGNHEYDFKNIDKRICHFDDGYRNSLGFEKFELRMLDRYLVAEEEENKRKAAEIKAKLPPHSVVLGSIGRLMKLSDDYLETVAEIMQQNPDTIYLACGSGPVEELRAKVKSLGIADRFIFTGWVNPHIYGYIIDIYLNTFPLVGGESVNEFLNKGDKKYVVSMRQ